MAILAIESDYANPRFRGSFYTFPTLVSQYVLIPRRQRFAVNQLVALYQFSEKTENDVYHFVGSYAGAAGWAQFIPTSMVAYFIPASGDFTDVDIYSIEDCIFSIGNYLKMHGLNERTMDSYKARYDAVFAYNRSDAYVKAVLYMYEKMREQRN
jgi:membrane-bound lytic murein transglycosylase B